MTIAFGLAAILMIAAVALYQQSSKIQEHNADLNNTFKDDPWYGPALGAGIAGAVSGVAGLYLALT